MSEFEKLSVQVNNDLVPAIPPNWLPYSNEEQKEDHS